MSLKRNVLPADPKPSHYALEIEPDFETFEFKGKVVIDLSAEKSTSSIVFNSNELVLSSGIVKCGDTEQSFTKDDFVMDVPDMRASLALKTPVVGCFTLSIVYTGTMNDKLQGFYRSKYTVQGKEAYLGTTQFEAVDARRALPCWDEPVHKASFDLTLVVPKEMTALSNMPEVARTDVVSPANYQRVTFNKTPIMSTYLLAWTIGHFEKIEATIPKSRGGETLVRIFTPENKVEQGRFALEVSCKVLPLYEKFFGSDYILPKCDLLAIPDFAAGAMENWGMITYRETALLCDDSSSAVHRQWVALVVAHELAHQWFGNLVTMEWWKELWLNESFATWVEYWAVDVLFPDWEIFTQFVNDETGRAMDLDALRSSHAVEVDVVNAQEIDEIFDAISYSKGGSVLRMVVEFIGLEAFGKGLTEYLEHFKFRNATTVDLWNFLGKAAGKDLAGILAAWTGQQGYPMLTVTKGTKPGTIKIRQNRFLSTCTPTEEEDSTIWQIPLLIGADGSDKEISVIITERETEVEVPTDAKWVKVNLRQSAFCRVKYDDEDLLKGLLVAISEKKVGAIDRLSLVSDYNAFASSGLIKTSDALQLLASYSQEDDYTVWCSITTLESAIRALFASRMDDTVSKELFNVYCRKLYTPAMKKLGYAPSPSDNHRLAQLRSLLLGRLVTSKDEATLKNVNDMFALRETNSIPADLRGPVYAAAVKLGEAGFNAVKDMFAATTDAMERARCLRALASASDVALVQRAADLALSDEVRGQDAIYLMTGIAGNAIGQEIYKNLLIQQWSRLWERFPGMLLGRVVKSSEALVNDKYADELVAFWPSVPQDQQMAMQRMFNQGVEGIRANASWAKRDLDNIIAFLQ